MERWSVLLALVLICGGCSTRIRSIYVPAGTPVQLRERIPAAKVWVADKDGNLVASEMDLPEGWWALEDPAVDSK